MFRYLLCFIFLSLTVAHAEFPPLPETAWRSAHEKPAMTIEETTIFMKELVDYVAEHHLKKNESSPQKGMIYEYFNTKKAGTIEQYVQGETLDTMHDGCWFAVAMVNAYRATGDPFYKEILTEWQLPFYLKMLNEGDTLFTSERNDARSGTEAIWPVAERTLRGREKGFVPYWWDDGGSVSMDMYEKADNLLSRPGRDEFAGNGKPNPEHILHGYSLGSSNHLAQELAIMLQDSWVLLNESEDSEDQKLAAEIAEAARNLQDCRSRHGAPRIQPVLAALAISNQDQEAHQKLDVVDWAHVKKGIEMNEYFRVVLHPAPKPPIFAPFFADEQAFHYHETLAASGRLTKQAAFLLAYDAFTRPKLYQMYRNDGPLPPGVSAFDLNRVVYVNGELKTKRTKRLIGSRFGSQNMIMCALSLQSFREYPKLWEEGREEIDDPSYFPPESGEEIRTWMEREVSGGLRTWEAVFKEYGYIPAGIDAGGKNPAGFDWEDLSHCGAYAYLIIAGAQWIHLQNEITDWDVQNVPTPTAK